MKNIILLILIGLNAPCAFTAESAVPFPWTPMARLHQSLGNFLQGKFNSYVELDEDLLSVKGPAPMILLAETVTSIMNNIDISSQRKAVQLLRKLEFGMSRMSLTDEQRHTFYKLLTLILDRYSNENSSPHLIVVKIFNRHNLWTTDELLFLIEKAKVAYDVFDYYEAFLLVGSQLDKAQLRELHLALNLARVQNLSQLMIKYQLGILEPERIQDLLKNMEREFRPPMYPLESYLEASQQMVRLRVFSLPILEDLQKRYSEGDRDIVHAVQGEQQLSTNRNADFFFSLFAKNDLKNLKQRFPRNSDPANFDPLDIAPRLAAQDAIATGVLSRIQERQGNMMRLDFTYKCVDLFILK